VSNRRTPARREFEALYRACVGFTWRTLRRLGVADGAIEDATQEVFMVAYRQFGAWEGRASVRSWLYGVALRVASHHHRSQYRHARKLAALPPPAQPLGLEQYIGDRSELLRVAAAIERLEPERRRVYELAEIEDLSAPEIAEALQLKLNTVYSRLRRARADLGRLLSELDGPASTSTPEAGRRSSHDRAR
jgi:RNA polymerase sigma-70 factor (ECF subfamily)